MAAPQTAEPIQLGVPVRGMNTRDPLAAMDPSYAPWALNLDPEPQYLRVRNGYIRHCSLGTDANGIFGLAAYGESALFAYSWKTGVHNDIWNVTTSTAVSAEHCADDTNILIAPGFSFARRLAFLAASDAADCGRVWDGSAWSAWGFTHSATEIGAMVATSYRGRVYIFNGAYMYYSDVAGVTGTTTRIDVSTLLTDPRPIVWAGVLSDATNKAAQTMLAFGTGSGEILIYSGDNPASPNWELVGRVKTSAPLFYNCTLEYNSDIWIATVTGIISLRAALSAGGEHFEEISVSSPIDPYWRALIAASVSNFAPYSPTWATYPTHASIAYWPEQNKIYVLVRGELSRANAFESSRGTMFVYNGYSKAWTIHHMASVLEPHCVVYFKNGIYFASANTVMKLGSGYKDELYSTAASYSAYPYVLESAYHNFGNANKNKQVKTIEPIIRTDFTGTDVTVKAASDFGRKVSAASSVPLLSGYQMPIYTVGVKGTFLQYRIEGNSNITASTGLEIYSVGASII